MAVTRTSIGTLGAYTLEWTSGTLLAEMASAIRQTLVDCSWTEHDMSAGANQYVYKTLLPGGIAGQAADYMYCMLDLNTSNALILKLYELWDATAHTGTNLAYATSNTVGMTLASANSIDIFSHGVVNGGAMNPLWLVIANKISGIRTAWHGVFVRTRASENDTTALGYPPTLWGSGATTQLNNGVFLAPRKPAAGSVFYGSLEMGAHAGGRPTAVNAFSLKPNVGNLWAIDQFFAFIYGATALKIIGDGLAIDGDFMDLPCDPATFLYTPEGSTIVRHMVIRRSGVTICFLVPIG